MIAKIPHFRGGRQSEARLKTELTELIKKSAVRYTHGCAGLRSGKKLYCAVLEIEFRTKEKIGMNGAESLIRTLVAGGVDTCFSNPGTSEMHIVAALDRIPEMRCVLGPFRGSGYRRGRRLCADGRETCVHASPSRTWPRQWSCESAQCQTSRGPDLSMWWASMPLRICTRYPAYFGH